MTAFLLIMVNPINNTPFAQAKPAVGWRGELAGNRRGKRLMVLLFVRYISGAPAMLADVPAEINCQGIIEVFSGPGVEKQS